ncbi:sensor histidine kinase [Microbispora sp. NEAU-D428]|uniref:sensor histidine kinase n=1 Tax=Microbispora sitophila TaxID=2771537 RepID=UPI0018690FCC|nr:sensor histidine kinase [Microbispora sitophila]MBE3008784.1 sensor histidine kinase [Microbispora sitophila]
MVRRPPRSARRELVPHPAQAMWASAVIGLAAPAAAIAPAGVLVSATAASPVTGLDLTGVGAAGLVGVLAAGLSGSLLPRVWRALRHRTQRMPYGGAGDPRLLAEALVDRLRQAGPAEALASVVATLHDGLGVTGVAVEVTDGLPGPLECGDVGPDPRRIPLVWHGELVGSLLIGPRGPRRFALAHDRVLAALAPYAADAAHAVRVSADLRRSRERVLAAREEERRRIRRDLHDGLGQTLSTMAMTINMARITLQDSAKADSLLADLRTGMDAVAGDIRRLVYGLRPPALDDLGLEGAIRALAGEGPPATRVTVSGDLAGLPSAVETAVYRIVQEALTNVRRHARAGAAEVEVEVTRTGTVRVRISDDGAGLPPAARAGVGTTSMRERAAEFGGTCAITSRTGGGTVVEALIPLPVDARQHV